MARPVLNKLSLTLVILLLASFARAQFPYADSFKNSSSPGTVFGGAPNPAFLTASATQAAVSDPAFTPDAPGAGYLRLTRAEVNQRGFMRNTQTFSSAEGLDISFEYYTYGGGGIGGGDGLTFFLFDASKASSFNTGGFGGSLGYAQRTDQGISGLTGAYLGIGIDEFGNFGTTNQGRVGGTGTAALRSAITLRGDGDGTQGPVQSGSAVPNSNYEFLTTIQTINAAALTAINAGPVFEIAGGQSGRTAPGGSLDPNETGYRKARILIEPNGFGTGYRINVFIRVGGELADRHIIQNYDYVSTLAPPAQLSYGFVSSTGGSTNIHEIRSLAITVPASIAKAPLLADLAKTVNQGQTLTFAANNFYSSDLEISRFKDPNGDALAKLRITGLPAHGLLKLGANNVQLNDEIAYNQISSLSYVPDAEYSGSDSFQWSAADAGGLYAIASASVNITVKPSEVLPPLVSESPDIYKIRVKLNSPTHASYIHADNPFNKRLVTMFQVDDSPKTISNLMFPYLHGGTTAGGYVSPGVSSTDGAGNTIYWNISAACFVQDLSGTDLLAGHPNYVSWAELATVTANGPGFQRGFDFTNHGFGGTPLLQRDRYKQIYLNNKGAYDHLGYHPEALVVPDVQIGFRFGANNMGMDVTSQAGPEPLRDGVNPFAEHAFSSDIYAAIQNPVFIRRNHWQETNSQALVAEHKSYMLAAWNKSQIKPNIYNWFSHGPGEAGTNNFAYYREVIDYLKEIGGDQVIGMSMEQYLGYLKTRHAAEHGTAKSSVLLPSGHLEITFDMSGLSKLVRNRLISLVLTSDGAIESIEKTDNIKALSFNAATGLVNIQLDESPSIDPATLPVRPTIVTESVKILASEPNTVYFNVDKPISQSNASAYEITGKSIASLSEVSGSGGLAWKIVCTENFLSTDVITLTYKAEVGNATAVDGAGKMLTYSNLPVSNLSQETPPEQPALAISIRRDSDNFQLATFNTIAETKAYLNTFNFNTNISVVFNNAQTYPLTSKWTLNYSNGNYTLTIKAKDGLPAHPFIDAQGSTSDPIRVAMNHVRIKGLKIRSGKYTSDGAQFGDNYSGAIISQEAGFSDARYEDLILHQGMRGIRIGGPNGTAQPNISDILIDKVVLSELTNIAIQVGILSTVGGEIESRTDASYTLKNVTISRIKLVDTRDQQDIESSGAKYYGQIQCRGVLNLVIRDVVSDQNQKQPIYVASSKNVLIDRCRATRFSLNTGTGYKAAFHIEDSEAITIQNSFAQAEWESANISSSRGISLYHNTFDTRQALAPAVSLASVRVVNGIEGNIFAARGDAPGRYPIGVSFNRTGGYVPTLQSDFIAERSNLFASAYGILEIHGIGPSNTSLNVTTNGTVPYSSYQSSYTRGQGSSVAPYASLFFTTVDSVEGYLDNGSAGRRLVSSPIAGITVDQAGTPRSYPSDAGAYHRPAVASADLASLQAVPGLLDPVYHPATTDYQTWVNKDSASVRFVFSPADIDASVRARVNAGSFIDLEGDTSFVASGLSVGENLVEFEMTASDSSLTKTYKVKVIRASAALAIQNLNNGSVAEHQAFSLPAPVLAGTPFEKVRYTLSGPDAYDFVLDHASGQVSMRGRDFEQPADADSNNVYEAVLTVRDQAGTTASKAFSVSVSDVAEAASFTIAGISDTTINENQAFTGLQPVIVGTPIGGRQPANFTIGVIPDVQHYTGAIFGGTNAIFKQQTNWLTASKQALNTKYVVQLGDIAQTGDNQLQWMRADTAMRIIEDPVSTQLPHGIPYGVNVGNHDQAPAGNASGSTAYFNQYFGSSRFSGRPYYGGHYGTNNDNNFQLFGAEGYDFIAINLEFDPAANAAVLNWADSLLKQYHSRRAIVSTHHMINSNGSFGFQGQAIYNKLKENSNLFLLLGGHINPNGEAYRSDTFNGNTVHAMLSDYQDRPNGGNGWMRYLEFSPAENKIYVSTYSPLLNEFENDENSRFSIDYAMTSGTAKGAVVYSLSGADAEKFSVDPSTGKVSMLARNFESPADADQDNVYSITLSATDADGNTAARSFKVTISDVIEPAQFAFSGSPNAEAVEGQAYTSPVPEITGDYIGNLTFSISGPDAGHFLLNPASGTVTMSAKEFAVPQDSDLDNEYHYTLTATDEDGNVATSSFAVKVKEFNPFPYAQSFRNSSAQGVVLGGSPNPAILTAGSADSEGNGYLRLSSNSNNQTGFARSTTKFPSAQGMSVSFDYYTYGGSGADGLAFFLYDASVSSFTIGGFGGSLGYAQAHSFPGVSKAFLGVGFDEFGNFSNPVANRQGGPGQRPSAVTLRGDGNGNLAIASNYEYLTSIQTTHAEAMSAAGAGNIFPVAGGVDGRTADGLNVNTAGYRRARIDLEPNAQQNGFLLNVWVHEGRPGGGVIHHLIKDYNYVPHNGIPAKLSYGFSAGTGGMNNFHEVRNLAITIPSRPEVAPLLVQVEKAGTENQVVPFTKADFQNAFDANGGDSLERIRIVSLPARGLLKVAQTMVNVNQEIDIDSIAYLTYEPQDDYSGSDAFQWNASNGSQYAQNPSFVNLTIAPAPVLPYSETFRQAAASKMIFGGSPIAAALTAGTIDPDGAGYLRLTTNATNQRGFARNTRAFPVEDGLAISFEYYTYGGNGADGISFFLYDSDADPFTIGGFGGALGYAQANGTPGVSKAYLGFGFDEFGNFGNPVAGRQGGPGQRTSSLTIRGDGNGSAAISSNYEYVTGIQTTNVAAMEAAGAGSAFSIAGGVSGRTAGAEGLTPLHTGYRKARIELRRTEAQTGFYINVWVTEGRPEGPVVHHLVNNFHYTGSTMPHHLSYGFAGSTGGSTNFHEIRNLNITVPEAPEMNLLMSLFDKSRNREGLIAKTQVANTAEPAPTNFISPNGDGRNDTWTIRNIEKYPGAAVTIFDRAGREVFKSASYNNDWDGRSAGRELDPGTYYYILEVPGKKEPLKGYVTIGR